MVIGVALGVAEEDSEAVGALEEGDSEVGDAGEKTAVFSCFSI